MPARSRFVPRTPIAPNGRRQAAQIVRDMRGLNSTDPYGILKPYASPYNRNARMYMPEQGRQVAISTRNGAKFYSVPVGETQNNSNSTEIIIDECDATTDWTATNGTLSLDTSIKYEATGSLKIDAVGGQNNAVFNKLNFSPTVDLSSDKGDLDFYAYFSAQVNSTVSRIFVKVSSDATFATNSLEWEVTAPETGSWSNGAWLKCKVDLSTAPTTTTGTVDRTAIKSIAFTYRRSITDNWSNTTDLYLDYITRDNLIGQADRTVNYIDAYAQPFTVSSNGVLTKLDIYGKSVAGSSPMTVKIYSDVGGDPGALLATSTIPYTSFTGSYSFVSARFVEAPTLATSTTYWYTVSIDDDTNTTYQIASMTAGTDAKASVNGGVNWSATTYRLYYKTYVSTSGGVKGMTRFYPSTASAVTFFAHGTDIYSVDDSTGAVTSRKSSLNSNATYTRYAQFDDAIFAVNGYDVMQRSTGTTFSDVTQAPFNPINVLVYENKLFIIDSTNKNLIRYSDDIDYTTWDATNFIYVPESKHSDPITGWIVFQNNIVVFTKNSKHIVSPVGIENFAVRQAIGNKGAVSQEAITADSNYIYFISGDGKMYRWNGSQDEELTRVIESDFDDVANIDNARLDYHDGKVYYWFQQTGGTVFNRNFVYDTEYKEWFYDNNRYVNGGLILKRDSNRFLLSNDRAGVLYELSDEWSDVGRPIDFEYHTNYFDLGSPDAIKRVRRLYFHLQKSTWAGLIQVGVDVDFADQPVFNFISVKSEGVGGVWGTFVWGTGTWATKDEYRRYKTAVPGTATYYQARIKRTGANTPVYFIGHSMYFRSRRPA